MRVPRDYGSLVAFLEPLGVAAAALVLGVATSAGAAQRPAADSVPVAERIAAIQAAASSTLPALDLPGDPEVERAWGYRWFNGPRRGWANWRPRWNNFRPRWNNFWRNW